MRLEELDALTAAPELWNDAARAQKLLSEKNSLEESVTALKQTETSLNELSELCELAEEEGNRELVAEIITQLEELKVKTRRGELEAKPTKTTPFSKFMPAAAAPRLRTGRKCCSECIPAGRKRINIRWNMWRKRKATLPG